MKCLGQSGGGAFEVAESRSKHGGRESAQGVSSGCMGHASQVIVFCTYNLDIIYIYTPSKKAGTVGTRSARQFSFPNPLFWGSMFDCFGCFV